MYGGSASLFQRLLQKKFCRYAAAVCFLLLVFCWANNTSLFCEVPNGAPKILAHRGLAQTFPAANLKWDTNTASIIYPPEHEFIENTLPSMQAAFACGAEIVEFDLRLTKDRKLAVFHDFLVDYRTDGHGNVADMTMDELRRLDVGYGYTADGGVTFPLRGKGIGMMVTFAEVLKAFPDRQFLVHLKDGGADFGREVVKVIKSTSDLNVKNLSFYGDHSAVAEVKRAFPQVKILSMETLKKAVIAYTLLGWTGYIPESMRETQVFMPVRYARYLWGWPTKFMQRMASVSTRVVLVRGAGKWSEGFDREEDLRQLPAGYTGYIWTNRADRIAPLLSRVSAGDSQ